MSLKVAAAWAPTRKLAPTPFACQGQRQTSQLTRFEAVYTAHRLTHKHEAGHASIQIHLETSVFTTHAEPQHTQHRVRRGRAQGQASLSLSPCPYRWWTSPHGPNFSCSKPRPRCRATLAHSCQCSRRGSGRWGLVSLALDASRPAVMDPEVLVWTAPDGTLKGRVETPHQPTLCIRKQHAYSFQKFGYAMDLPGIPGAHGRFGQEVSARQR